MYLSIRYSASRLGKNWFLVQTADQRRLTIFFESIQLQASKGLNGVIYFSLQSDSRVSRPVQDHGRSRRTSPGCLLQLLQ